jgi:pimeloyl-ACP methyl ester carboxylesterase
MSRIPTPASIADAPEKSRPLLEAVNKQFGVVPNMFRLISTSPQALEGYLGLSGALGHGALPAATRERIALAVAVAAYDSWHAAFRTHHPRTLIIWGRNDPFFIPAGAEAYLRDLPEARLVWLDAGHFVLDENAEHVAAEIKAEFTPD